jgi:hypothetical protein
MKKILLLALCISLFLVWCGVKYEKEAYNECKISLEKTFWDFEWYKAFFSEPLEVYSTWVYTYYKIQGDVYNNGKLDNSTYLICIIEDWKFYDKALSQFEIKKGWWDLSLEEYLSEEYQNKIEKMFSLEYVLWK